MKYPKVLAGLVLALASFLAHAELQVVRFYGYAYDLTTGKYIYTEVYRANIDGDRWLGGEIKYYYPDGRLMGDKVLDFTSNPYIPIYTLKLPDSGYSEGITKIDKNGIAMFKDNQDKGRQTVTLSMAKQMAGDSGFHNYLCDHMADLVAGKTVKFRFAAAGQLDAYNFRARKIGDTEFEGKPAIKLIAEPDSLIRFVADPLTLTYDPQTKHLLEFQGMSNIINPKTGEVYKKARIVFASVPPGDAPKNLPPLEDAPVSEPHSCCMNNN